jgi:aromatic-L-amino-acid decarboxylase
VYLSDQAHSSVDKAVIVLGLGEASLRHVASDEAFRMQPSALRECIASDRRAGFTPCAVVATVGTTSTAAVDPVAEIADICARERLWLHVDAAYGGAMGLLPEGRWALEGVTEADSVVVNPHKWLFVPLDFSAFYTRRPDVVRAVFSLTPSYLEGDAGGHTMRWIPVCSSAVAFAP